MTLTSKLCLHLYILVTTQLTNSKGKLRGETNLSKEYTIFKTRGNDLFLFSKPEYRNSALRFKLVFGIIDTHFNQSGSSIAWKETP